jgi:hypothetical protein
MSYHNVTPDNLTIIIREPSISFLPDENSLNNVSSILIPVTLITFIIIGIAFATINFKTIINEKIDIPSLVNKIKNMYKEYAIQQILPTYNKHKAKESPFIGSVPTLQLPPCSRLDRSEKEQNMQFKVSIPYRRLNSSENLASNEEHRITITTFVHKTPTVLNS